MYSVVVFTPTDRTQQNCIVASRTDSCVDPISLIQPNPAPGITDVDPTKYLTQPSPPTSRYGKRRLSL